MTIKRLIPAVILACCGLAIVAGPAPAGDDFSIFDQDRHLIVIDDDGERYEMFIEEDGEIRVVDEDGEIVTEIDIQEFAQGISAVVQEALGGMHEALAELSQLDFSFDWDGDDGSLHCMIDDDDFDIDIDVDEIRAEVAAALEGLRDLDFDDECIVLHGREYDGDDLQKEVDKLRDEIGELRNEIKQLRRRQHR